jgi:hypothetical protein
MAQVTTRGQEYWRPPNANAVRLIESQPGEALCWNCESDYSPAARFCHVCGCPRDGGSGPAAQTREGRGVGSTQSRAHLSLPSLLCLVLAIGCIIGAGLVSVVYRTDTLTDWQAVQTWRIEWLLAAMAALLAGILLKKSS